jgi:hypothetical protein
MKRRNQKSVKFSIISIIGKTLKNGKSNQQDSKGAQQFYIIILNLIVIENKTMHVESTRMHVESTQKQQ